MTPAPFSGFPADAFAFYRELEVNNERPWWLANKARYDGNVRAPFEALARELAGFGSARIFRPHRDVRFSADKSPYKTHQGMLIGGVDLVGFYVAVEPFGLRVGAGFHGDAADTKRYRAAVDAPAPGSELAGLVDELEADGYERGGDRVATAPRGVPRDHPRIDLMRHKQLVLTRTFPPEAGSDPSALDLIFRSLEDLQPFVDWCHRHVAEGRERTG